MKILSFIILYLFFSTAAFTQEIHAELSLNSPPQILKEGDVLEGVLKVWPLENADLNEFKKLEETTFGEGLYIEEVSSVAPSPNNADVVEAKILLVVKKSEEKLQQINYKGRLINIQLPDIKIADSGKPSEGYFVLDQGTIYSNMTKIITLVVLIILLVLVILNNPYYSITS